MCASQATLNDDDHSQNYVVVMPCPTVDADDHKAAVKIPARWRYRPLEQDDRLFTSLSGYHGQRRGSVCVQARQG
jgi:hypothetical protein